MLKAKFQWIRLKVMMKASGKKIRKGLLLTAQGDQERRKNKRIRTITTIIIIEDNKYSN